jgi:cytochrome c553
VAVRRLVAVLVALAAPAAAEEGNVKRGRAVVAGAFEGGTPQVACLSCHGMDGRGDGSAAFPRITGQNSWYLYKQLRDYAAGTRPNEIMTPVARALNEGQMQDAAAYYAAQEARYPDPPEADPLLVQRGGALSAVGSSEKQIPACVACHGPAGTGLPPSGPYLAGQYAGYTELQLRLWQEDRRDNDALDVMADIAKRMTPEDVKAAAAYFAQVRPLEQ